MKNKKNSKNKRQANELITLVANNIRQYRLKKGKTQEWLEHATNLNISRCESGEHEMTLTTINILSIHLNVHPYELLK